MAIHTSYIPYILTKTPIADLLLPIALVLVLAVVMMVAASYLYFYF
jgi:hypothetical protein